jgi:glucosamine 6-phosphate synthetase-like amidotransferase/phosphosugar isomerase protein
LKDAIINIIEQKMLGTFRLTVLETNKPKFMYFAKNVGNFIIGTNADSSEIVVSSDAAIIK